ASYFILREAFRMMIESTRRHCRNETVKFIDAEMARAIDYDVGDGHSAVVSSGKLKVPTDGAIEMVGDVAKSQHAGAHKIADAQNFYAYFNIIPERTEGTIDGVKAIIHKNNHRLIAVNEIVIGGKKLICANIQYLLFCLLAKSHVDEAKRNMYYLFYESTKAMIKCAEAILADLKISASAAELSARLQIHSPFFLSIKVFGHENYSEAYEIQLRALHAEIGLPIKQIPLPVNYYPSRGKTRPTFDYSTSKYFLKDGS